MNIRSLSNPAQVLAKDKIEASKAIKSDQTEDREANGQQPRSDGEAHRSLTEDELQQVLAKIKDNEGIKNSGLSVELVSEGNQWVVKILSPEAKVVRRFVERDLYFFLFESKEEKIHLVNKTA